ncbi:MAG: carboxypeptidase-like regulatory domain-containing protein [Acidobacteriota bacterium]
MKGRVGAGNGLGCWGRLVLVLLVLLVGEGALQLLFQYQRRCPPVSGVVVDRDTGRPIAGAFVTRQMLGMSRNFLYYLGGSSGPTPLLPFAGVLTDAGGRFSFPADRTVMKPSESGDPFIYVYGPDIRHGIQLVVYSPEYIPVRSQEEGFDWKKEEWLSLDQEHTHDMRNPKWKVVGPTGFSVTRSGNLWTGYQYRIEMIKAVTEAQWEEKWHETWLLNSLYIPKSISDQWLFNDLTGYLERWPQGEKAGEYLECALSTGMGASCSYLRSELATGSITIEQLRVYQQRNALLLELGKRVSPPARGGIRYRSYQSSLQSLEATNKCIEEITGRRRMGGKEQ